MVWACASAKLRKKSESTKKATGLSLPPRSMVGKDLSDYHPGFWVSFSLRAIWFEGTG